MNKLIYEEAFNNICIENKINCPGLFLYEEVDSTNNVIDEKAREGAQEGICAIASQQTLGQGRSGRTFYSPSGGNLYMSFLLRPKNLEMISYITPAAAVASSCAIADVCNIQTGIKWVNDLYYNGKKVSGMIAKGYNLAEMDKAYVVVGIGINVHNNSSKIPENVRDIYGSLYDSQYDAKEETVIAKLSAAVYGQYMRIYRSISDKDYGFMSEYRKRSIVIGKNATYVSGEENHTIRVIDIDMEGSLIVEETDGSINTYRDGEIRIKITE